MVECGMPLTGERVVSPEGWVRDQTEKILATGTTAFQPTFVTAPEAALLDALRAMPVGGIGARVLGAHVRVRHQHAHVERERHVGEPAADGLVDD